MCWSRMCRSLSNLTFLSDGNESTCLPSIKERSWIRREFFFEFSIEEFVVLLLVTKKNDRDSRSSFIISLMFLALTINISKYEICDSDSGCLDVFVHHCHIRFSIPSILQIVLKKCYEPFSINYTFCTLLLISPLTLASRLIAIFIITSQKYIDLNGYGISVLFLFTFYYAR